METLESSGILLCHSPGKRPLVLESSGNLEICQTQLKYEV